MRRSQPYARETGVAAAPSSPPRGLLLAPALRLRAILDRIKADFVNLCPLNLHVKFVTATFCAPIESRQIIGHRLSKRHISWPLAWRGPTQLRAERKLANRA
jgi:hypothetical protein